MLKHLWCQNKPWATSDSQDSPRPRLGGSHHLPSYSILCTSLQGLHSNGFFVPRVPKLPRLELLQICGATTSCSNLRSGRGLKQSCSSHRELFNSVSHATCMHKIQVDSRHFMVGSQTGSLTPDFSFCHNLCYRCLNGPCEPILDIYTSIVFE